MSLKKRLIPLSVLACAPIFSAPLTLTSCGNNLENSARDLTHNYYPKYERHETAILTQHEIHDLYLDKLLSNPDVFIDDYFWSRSWEGTTFEPYQFWRLLLPDASRTSNAAEKIIIGPSENVFESDKESFSNLKITTQDAEINNEKWTFPTLSFTLNINAKVKETEFDVEDTPQYVSGYANGNITCELKFTNVPFILTTRTYASEYQSLSSFTLSFEPFGDWLEGVVYNTPKTRPNPWRISVSVHSSIFGEMTYASGMVQRIADDYEFNAISDEENPSWTYGSQLSFRNTLCCLFTSSHYLEMITCKEEK